MNRQLTYIILAVIVLIFIGMMIRDWRFSAKKNTKRPAMPVSKNGLEITLPLCLQAYERLVVFLERSRPDALIRRLYRPDLNVREMRQLLIQNIRSEFEHNLSQQVYVSTPAWDAVANAIEQLIHLINTTASRLPSDDQGSLLQKALLDLDLHEEELPVATALKVVNSEAKKLLGYHKNT